jgi:aspartate aminotransferase
LETVPGYRCTQPDGAFYVFPEVIESMQKMGIICSSDYAKFLIREARVATVPGSAFGLEGHIRLSYATSMKNIEKALERIRTAVK